MRTGNVWRWFMQNREIPVALERVGILKYASREVLYDKNKSKRYNHELRAARVQVSR
jgi:hypothetical protein